MARWTEARFSQLLSPHLAALYRLAFRLTTRKADAEDLFQDVLTKLFERRAELSSIRDLPPYLGRVLYNQFIDDKRRYGRQPLRLVDNNRLLEDLPAGADPQREAEEAQTRDRLSRALGQLSEEHRLVVVLADVEGHSLQEMEALTDLPIGTLKSRLHRARGRLRELLRDEGTFSGASTCSSMEGVKRDAL